VLLDLLGLLSLTLLQYVRNIMGEDR